MGMRFLLGDEPEFHLQSPTSGFHSWGHVPGRRVPRIVDFEGLRLSFRSAVGNGPHSQKRHTKSHSP